MSTLGDELPKEQQRVRELLAIYREIGPGGAMAAAMMEQSLRAADQASASGDLVAMIRAYTELKEYTG